MKKAVLVNLILHDFFSLKNFQITQFACEKSKRGRVTEWNYSKYMVRRKYDFFFCGFSRHHALVSLYTLRRLFNSFQRNGGFSIVNCWVHRTHEFVNLETWSSFGKDFVWSEELCAVWITTSNSVSIYSRVDRWGGIPTMAVVMRVLAMAFDNRVPIGYRKVRWIEDSLRQNKIARLVLDAEVM